MDLQIHECQENDWNDSQNKEVAPIAVQSDVIGVLHLIKEKRKSIDPGVGKVRPAGQIRPAEVFGPACGGYFATHLLMFHLKISFSVYAFSVWPKGSQFF